MGVTSEDVPGLPLTGGFETLQTLANVPRTWPLARLTIPLSGFSKQLERLLEGYCLELFATNAVPEQHNGAVRQFAKDLVMVLAMHLAQRIASLLRNVMDHPLESLGASSFGGLCGKSESLETYLRSCLGVLVAGNPSQKLFQESQKPAVRINHV